MKAPIPKDLVPILAREKWKQDEIMAKVEKQLLDADNGITAKARKQLRDIDHEDSVKMEKQLEDAAKFNSRTAGSEGVDETASDG